MPRQRKHSTVSLVTSTVMLSLFLAILCAVMLNAEMTTAIDTWVRGFALSHQSTRWFWSSITALGGTMIISIVIIVTIILIRKNKKRLIFFCSTAAITLIVSQSLKSVIERARPEYLPTMSYSFPSGHACMSTAVYGAIMLMLWHDARDNSSFFHKRHALLWLLPVLIILISASRIMLDVHWFTDVVAGITLAVGIIAAVLFVQESVVGS